MRLIARSTLREYGNNHAAAKPHLTAWEDVVKAAKWASMNDVRSQMSSAVPLNAERVRFEIGGNNFRLIAAIDFDRQVVFVKFIGTHAEYDKVDALTVSQF
jgi:mRNA interferase HigB